jgi:hypothetical protein
MSPTDIHTGGSVLDRFAEQEIDLTTDFNDGEEAEMTMRLKCIAEEEANRAYRTKAERKKKVNFTKSKKKKRKNKRK